MVYKSEEGKSAVRNKVKELIAGLDSGWESRYLDTGRFGRTHCLIAGRAEKPVLVLLHGTSSNSLSWAGYMKEWLSSYRLIVPDLPGQPGLSSEVRPPVKEMGLWLGEVLDALAVETCFLCGMSLGGWTAMRYTLDNRERVRALALIAPSGLARPRLSFFLRILPLMLLGDGGARRINRLVYGPVPIGPDEEAFGLLVARHFLPLAESIPLFSEEELERLTQPLYYAGGGRDVLLDTLASAERIPRTEGGTKIRILPDMGHVILDRAPEIDRFFRDGVSR